MSRLEAALADYLGLRRALGHKLDDAGRQLARFVNYLDFIGAETVSLEAAMAFVLDPDLDPDSTVPARRLTAVRGFARHLAAQDPWSEIPPPGLVSYRVRHRIPHIFSDEDVGAVIAAARASSPFAFRAETLGTLIAFLAVTGMRVGEALRLDRSEVDWDNAVVRVRNTKFGKARDVAVSDSTLAALAAYTKLRDRQRPQSPCLFVSLSGTPVAYSHFSATFRNAVRSAGVGDGSGVQPRVHDLRHSFAVRTLLGWYREGRDVEALLPRLSTYLGHREPRFTYRYLSATPELLGLAASRLEASLAELWP